MMRATKKWSALLNDNTSWYNFNRSRFSTEMSKSIMQTTDAKSKIKSEAMFSIQGKRSPHRTKGFVWSAVFFGFFAVHCLAAYGLAYEDGICIVWDDAQREFVCSGTYARAKLLANNQLVLVYSARSSVYFRSRNEQGNVWSTAVEVARDDQGIYNYTNAELLELQNGTLIYTWNARPRVDGVDPYKIMIKRSDDGGATWSGEQTLYEAGTLFGDGCWEPAFLQLPIGEVQIYFANEAPYTTSNEQEISLLRSFDNGLTWSNAEKISFRTGSRDGMPVPVNLQNGKGIALAIEDNGIDGTFKPVIVHSSIADNWLSGYVSGDSSRRWHALRSDCRLPADTYVGAPYLIQLHSGETLLSVQSAERRNPENTHRRANMQIYIGTDEAKDFSQKSTPFPSLPDGGSALWSSLCQTSDTTVMAVSSLSGLPNQNGVWTVTGHIIKPMEIKHKAEGKAILQSHEKYTQ